MRATVYHILSFRFGKCRAQHYPFGFCSRAPSAAVQAITLCQGSRAHLHRRNALQGYVWASGACQDAPVNTTRAISHALHYGVGVTNASLPTWTESRCAEKRERKSRVKYAGRIRATNAHSRRKVYAGCDSAAAPKWTCASYGCGLTSGLFSPSRTQMGPRDAEHSHV